MDTYDVQNVLLGEDVGVKHHLQERENMDEADNSLLIVVVRIGMEISEYEVPFEEDSH